MRLTSRVPLAWMNLTHSSRRFFLSVLGISFAVVLMLVWLTPAIVSLGRSLDFVSRDPPPPGMQRFWVLHAAYTSLEMIKLVVGIVVTAWVTRTASPAPSA